MKRVKQSFLLAFPYLCALAVIGLIAFGNARSRRSSSGDVAAGPCAGCGNAIEAGSAHQIAADDGSVLSFCCPGCVAAAGDSPSAGSASRGAYLDPVCSMTVGDGNMHELDGTPYYFCTDNCREAFVQNPGRYLAEVCPVCRADGVFTAVGESSIRVTWEGEAYRFCTEQHRADFRSDPAGYFMHTMWGIPNWLYYASVAGILVLSFGVFEWRSRKSDVPEEAVDSGSRIDLLRIGPVRRLFVHPRTRFTCQFILLGAFVMILTAGLFGNQLPGRNVAPLLTWTVWWGGLICVILYLGKAWCYVCPWNAIADWVEGVRLWGPTKNGLSLNIKWPRWMRNIWPATLLFVGLTWIELGFGVTMNPRFTAWLGLGMLALAFACALVFERRSFCRYGCLVGRVSGLYALFAPFEVRARDKDVCTTCTSKACYRGSDAGDGCPTGEFLGTMSQNTYCISCMECVKTCDRDNVALQMRPWGADLAVHHRPRSDEAYLALIMLALTGFHGLTMTACWQDVVDWFQALSGFGEIASFSLGMGATMVLPILMYAALVGVSRMLSRDASMTYHDYFVRYAYAVLPIALFYHLAHNSEHLLMEGQKVIALLSDPLGRGWDLFGTAEWELPPMVDLPTLWIVQVLFVIIGHVYSLWVAHRVAGQSFKDQRAAFWSQLPMLAAMILFSLMSLWLLKQPMQMRSSAM